MKSLLIIALFAVTAAFGSLNYVNAGINERVAQFKTSTLQETAPAKMFQPAKQVQTTARVQQTQRAAQLLQLSPGVEMTQSEMLQQDVELEVR